MNRPRRFLLRMSAFLAVVAVVVAALREDLFAAFMANPPLNGLILGVLALGIAFTFRQVLGLSPEVRWIEEFRDGEAEAPARRPRLLAPMARMLADRKGRVALSALAMRSLLDSIGARLDESRDISRYLIGLLIFLGLLGTFWGLLDTVGSVGTVIGGLNVDSDDLVGTFAALKGNLEGPLAGMGTAFSSSLFGLAGSLVLGFLDLQASQAQNQFYNDLEEWLSSVTRLSSGSGIADGEQSVPVYVQALLERTADSLDELQRTLTRGEEERRAASARATELTENVAALADQNRAARDLLDKVAESQRDVGAALQRLAEGGGASGGVDEATRGHIRNVDVHLARLIEETVSGRSFLASELRSEVKLLGRVIAAAADRRPPEPAAPPPAPEPREAPLAAAPPPPPPPAPEAPAAAPAPAPAPAAAPRAAPVSPPPPPPRPTPAPPAPRPARPSPPPGPQSPKPAAAPPARPLPDRALEPTPAAPRPPFQTPRRPAEPGAAAAPSAPPAAPAAPGAPRRPVSPRRPAPPRSAPPEPQARREPQLPEAGDAEPPDYPRVDAGPAAGRRP